MKILLNCDLGEGEAEATTAGLLPCADLANIACGGHADDGATMRRVLRSALARGVQPGALAGWPDRDGFGKTPVEISPREVRQLLAGQVGALRRAAREEGAVLGHVKLHEALARWCDRRAELAEACVDWMQEEAEAMALVVGAGGLLHAVAEARGVALLREIFAARGYLDEARLVPRGEPGDSTGDAALVAARIREWRATGFLPLTDGRRWLVEAETVCVPADSPESIAIARAVREVLGEP